MTKKPSTRITAAWLHRQFLRENNAPDSIIHAEGAQRAKTPKELADMCSAMRGVKAFRSFKLDMSLDSNG
jgi:hypothetical protein